MQAASRQCRLRLGHARRMPRILLGQFFRAPRALQTRIHVEPALLVPRHMIESAVADAALRYDHRRGLPTEISREAMAWLTSREFYPGSFHWCASWLNEDPNYLRKIKLQKVWAARRSIRIRREMRAHGREVRQKQ